MKTPIGIASYDEALRNKSITGPGLIIVKASLKTQWLMEVEKFSNYKARIIKTYKDNSVKYLQAIKQKERQLAKDKDNIELISAINRLYKEMEEAFNNQFKDIDLFIINYETLNDDKVRQALHKINPQYIFADEVHYIRSDTTKRAKMLCEFNTSTYKIGATATPLQRDPRDIYGIFKFINPSLFPKKSEFNALYIKWGGYGRPIGALNTDKLNTKISENMIIKSKEEIAKQLPKLIVSQRYCNLEPKQEEMMQKLFEELEVLRSQEKALIEKLTPKELKTNEEYLKIEAGIMARQTFAQELSDSEQLLLNTDSEMAKNYVTGSNDNKLDLLIELITEIIESGEKVAIFSKFKRMQDIITKRIQKEKDLKDIKIAYVNGSMNTKQRYEEIYTKYRDTEEYKVLLMSEAAAEGVNLSTTKYLIEYDLADSYAIQTQRHGRLERADSIHDTVFVYQLIARNSWDEIAQKIVDKKEVYDTKIVKGVN